MQSSDSENNTNNDSPPQKSWRWNEDGTYNNKPSSPTYFNEYYHKNLSIKVECPYCKKLVAKQTLGRHISTVQKCIKSRNI